MEGLGELRSGTGAAWCVECGKCSATCPLADSAGFSARAIASRELQEGVQHGSGVRRCLTCGSCEVRCPQGIQFAEYVKGLRGLIPAEQRDRAPHGEVFQSAGRAMAEGPPPKRDLSWLDDDLRVAEQGEIALFVGCLPLFDLVFEDQLGLKTVDIARSAVRLLNRMGIEPVILSQERCCGHDLLWGGDHASFRALAEANSALFSERGVQHILTTCAECCRTWSVDYPEVVPAYRPRVQHLAEFLAERLDDKELEFIENGETTVTFQDPCRLGRHLGVYDAPRKMLEALPGTRLQEMSRTKRDALCCGTCGFTHCDAESRRMQTTRLAHAADTGATKLVTACPKCLIHFTCAQAEDRRSQDKPPAIEVQDLTVLLAERLQGLQKTEELVMASQDSAPSGREGGDA